MVQEEEKRPVRRRLSFSEAVAPLSNLPHELSMTIGTFATLPEALNLFSTNQSLRRLTKDDALWIALFERDLAN
jgi:hypothetical protein